MLKGKKGLFLTERLHFLQLTDSLYAVKILNEKKTFKDPLPSIFLFLCLLLVYIESRNTQKFNFNLICFKCHKNILKSPKHNLHRSGSLKTHVNETY